MMENFNFSKSNWQKSIGEKAVVVIIKAKSYANDSRSWISNNSAAKGI